MTSKNPEPSGEKPAIDQEFLDFLVCPESHGPLVLQGDKLCCYQSRKAYRIEDGMPVLLIEEPEEIPESEIPEEFRGSPPNTAE